MISFRSNPSCIVGDTCSFFGGMLALLSSCFTGETFAVLGVGDLGNFTGRVLSILRFIEIVMRAFLAMQLAGSGFTRFLKVVKRQIKSIIISSAQNNGIDTTQVSHYTIPHDLVQGLKRLLQNCSIAESAGRNRFVLYKRLLCMEYNDCGRYRLVICDCLSYICH